MDGYNKDFKKLNAKHLMTWKLIEKYSKENMSEFRKSISAMGTTVKNGTVVYDTGKTRREPRISVEDIFTSLLGK